MASARITCKLCSKVYNKPKLLPCFHTFCESCLYDYIGKHSVKEQFVCPSCNLVILVPSNIADDLKTNHFIQAFIEQRPIQDGDTFESCDICKSTTDEGYACKECEQKICHNCNSVHASMKATKDHTVKKIKGPRRAFKLQRICKEHDEDLRFYCRTCFEGVCVDCKMNDHEGHSSEHVAEAKTKGRQSLTCVSNRLRSHLRDLTCELDALSYRKRLIEKSYIETSVSIKEQADAICKLVFVVRDEKLREAEKLHHEQQTEIEKVESAIKTWEQQVSTASEYVDFINRSNSEVSVLETCDKMEERMRLISEYDCPSLDVQCTELAKEEDIKAQVGDLFGKINQYPALRLRLTYGSTSSFECEPEKKVVDAICPLENDTAWIASHTKGEERSSLILCDANRTVLNTISYGQRVKSLAILDGTIHALTTESFLKLNSAGTELEPVVSPSLPVLLASNTTSMFYLSQDHTCHYVSITDVKPIEETFLCLLQELRNPTKMAVDENQNIVIIDGETVKIFDFNGDPQNISCMEYPNFRPLDVCIDKWSDILIVDSGNEAIHELSADGKGREIMYSRFSGLKNVCCIAGDDDALWFGSSDGTIVVKHL